jgi:RNA polymerase-binding transcription factor DksA
MSKAGSKKPTAKSEEKSAEKSAAKPSSAPAPRAASTPASTPASKAPASKTTAKTVGAQAQAPKQTPKQAPKQASKQASAQAPKSAPSVDAKSAAKSGSKNEAKPAVDAKAPAKASLAGSSAKAPAPAKSAAGGGGKSDAGKPAGDTPLVPKKGPIDLAQHKSVAAAAAAVAQARPSDTGEFIIINGRRVRAISTKGLTIAKKSKTAAVEAPPAPTEQQIAEIKTKLSKKELDEYRTLLLAKRRQLVGMLNGMEDEALRSSGGNLSNMPVHMADMGSDVYEQDFTLGMAETERAILDEIDAALLRIENKTFGVCQMTGKPISKARLDAKPWAKYTIEAERIAESGGAR